MQIRRRNWSFAIRRLTSRHTDRFRPSTVSPHCRRRRRRPFSHLRRTTSTKLNLRTPPSTRNTQEPTDVARRQTDINIAPTPGGTRCPLGTRRRLTAAVSRRTSRRRATTSGFISHLHSTPYIDDSTATTAIRVTTPKCPSMSRICRRHRRRSCVSARWLIQRLPEVENRSDSPMKLISISDCTSCFNVFPQ